MNFGQAISSCFSNYATFSGRASRSEFWWFFLFQLVVCIVASIFGDLIVALVNLGLVLPAFAVGARRLHDIGKSGWWQLLVLTLIGILLLIYWWVQPGNEAGNSHDAASA